MARYRPSSEVVSTELNEEEAVLLSLETQQYYSLNETGRRIWALLSDGYDAPAIAESLTKEWDVPRDKALEYVRSFLSELNEQGLVEAVERG